MFTMFTAEEISHWISGLRAPSIFERSVSPSLAPSPAPLTTWGTCDPRVRSPTGLWDAAVKNRGIHQPKLRPLLPSQFWTGDLCDTALGDSRVG